MLYQRLSLILVTLFALTACGGSDSGSNAPAQFRLSVTDAPIDSASNVFVIFTGVTVQPQSGERIEFTFAEPREIDLLALQGTESELLIDETIEPGNYNWIRLNVDAELDGRGGEGDSRIVLEDGNTFELWVPSGSERGLQLNNGFTAAVGGVVDFTIDFDLRKSITNPIGQDGYILRPTLRMVNNLEVGSLAGTISSDTLTAECADPSTEVGAVYVFTGADATVQDVQGNDGDPLVSALVALQQDSNYGYEVGFLETGDYTVAYTCQAVSDDPETADEITFVGTSNVSITAGNQTTLDF